MASVGRRKKRKTRPGAGSFWNLIVQKERSGTTQLAE